MASNNKPPLCVERLGAIPLGDRAGLETPMNRAAHKARWQLLKHHAVNAYPSTKCHQSSAPLDVSSKHHASRLHKLEMRAAADAVPALVEGAKLSPRLKAALMERLMECRIDRAVSRADLEGSEPVVATEELFRLKNRDVESILRENPGASGFVWKRRERSRVLERRKVPLAAAVGEAAA